MNACSCHHLDKRFEPQLKTALHFSQNARCLQMGQAPNPEKFLRGVPNELFISAASHFAQQPQDADMTTHEGIRPAA